MLLATMSNMHETLGSTDLSGGTPPSTVGPFALTEPLLAEFTETTSVASHREGCIVLATVSPAFPTRILPIFGSQLGKRDSSKATSLSTLQEALSESSASAAASLAI
uniref:Uncharacterized protein n=1 Tax=Arundo donax TaxID=35708 RepID=A0A0A9DBV3_ARUDO